MILDAHENGPTCAQFSGPTECAGMSGCASEKWGQAGSKGIPQRPMMAHSPMIRRSGGGLCWGATRRGIAGANSLQCRSGRCAPGMPALPFPSTPCSSRAHCGRFAHAFKTHRAAHSIMVVFNSRLNHPQEQIARWAVSRWRAPTLSEGMSRVERPCTTRKLRQ